MTSTLTTATSSNLSQFLLPYLFPSSLADYINLLAIVVFLLIGLYLLYSALFMPYRGELKAIREELQALNATLKEYTDYKIN